MGRYEQTPAARPATLALVPPRSLTAAGLVRWSLYFTTVSALALPSRGAGSGRQSATGQDME